MSFENERTKRDLRRAHALIENVLRVAGDDIGEPTFAPSLEPMGSDDLRSRIEELIGSDSSRVRIALGTAGYSDTLTTFIGGMMSAQATFTTLCSPDLCLDAAAELLTPGCLDLCRVSHFQVPNWILVDGACAIVESNEPDAGMIHLTSPPIIAILTSWFDQIWKTATKYDTHARLRQRRECEMTRDILAYLAQGMTDDVAADRLGISVRTYRRHVSELYGDLGAQSRFQAGMRAERLLVRYWT